MIIRQATLEDQEKLLKMESELSQGEHLILKFEKKDFFYLNNFFKNIYFVAEENNKLIGSAAIGFNKFRFNNRELTAGYIHSLRIAKPYQNKNIREFILVLKEFFKIFKEKDLDFVYGFIKHDNNKAKNFALKRKFSLFDRIDTGIIPIFGKQKDFIIEYKKIDFNEPNLLIPQHIDFYQYKSTIFNFIDYSPFQKIKVEKIPLFLSLLAKILYGPKIYNRFENNHRVISYGILNIVRGDDREIKEVIQFYKSYCFKNHINILGIVQRKHFKPFNSPIKTTFDLFVLQRNVSFLPNQFIVDVF